MRPAEVATQTQIQMLQSCRESRVQDACRTVIRVGRWYLKFGRQNRGRRKLEHWSLSAPWGSQRLHLHVTYMTYSTWGKPFRTQWRISPSPHLSAKLESVVAAQTQSAFNQPYAENHKQESRSKNQPQMSSVGITIPDSLWRGDVLFLSKALWCSPRRLSVIFS